MPLCRIFKLCTGCRQSVPQRTGARRLNPADGLALLQAAQSGDERAVRGLLGRGVPADLARTRRLETALFLAAEHGHADVVRALLEHGADPSVPNEDGAGAITQAAAAGRVDLIKDMRRYHQEAFHKPAALLALLQASLGAHPGALQALLRGGAPASSRLPNLPPVLHYAAVSCATCVQILLRAGVDPNCVDHKGRTALHRAAWADRADCVRVLVAAGARLDARAVDGRRPWHLASSMHVRNMLIAYVLSQRWGVAGSTPPRDQPSRSCPLPRRKTRLSTERVREEGDSQPVRGVGAAGPSYPASPGAPHNKDAPACSAAGPSVETSPGATYSQGAPPRSAAGPSGVTSPGISPSSNDAPANAGAEPSGESISTTSSSPVAEPSGVTFQGISSAPSAKFSSKGPSD